MCAGDLAKLITISVAMFQDVFHFVTILGLFVASFSVIFYVLLRGVGDSGHEQVIDAVYSTFTAMLGDFDSSIYISNAGGPIHELDFHRTSTISILVIERAFVTRNHAGARSFCVVLCFILYIFLSK